jgi:hypothetical protein
VICRCPQPDDPKFLPRDLLHDYACSNEGVGAESGFMRAVRSASSREKTNRSKAMARNKGKFFVWLGCLALAAAALYVGIPALQRRLPLQRIGSQVNVTVTRLTPRDLKEMLALEPRKLEGVDVALMNLLCADGLPGSEGLRIDTCLQTLDQWARRVDSETRRHLYRLQRDPSEFNNSEAYFRVLMLITVLQQDFKVHYNPARISSPESPEPAAAFFADSRDLFLHGIVGARAMGTCISMPVFYVAVGRRLGYPMKLVTARDHLFARWESRDGKERFNIEGTNQGLSTPDDDYYKKWPYPVTDEEIRSGWYLKSLTPSEELAIFLQTRGHCLRVAGFFGEAKAAYQQAQARTPSRPENQVFLASMDRAMAPRTFSHAELDAMADYGNRLNEYNRQIMQTRGQVQAGASPVMPPALPISAKP